MSNFITMLINYHSTIKIEIDWATFTLMSNFFLRTAGDLRKLIVWGENN